MKKYKESLAKIEHDYKDADDIDRIRTILKYQKMKCFKYNSDLDPESSSICFFESTLQLTKDEQKFIIMNRRYLANKRYGKVDNNVPTDVR